MSLEWPSAMGDRRLLLRADGSGDVGLGHLMRLFALGQAWSDRGGTVELIVAEAPDPILAGYAAEGFVVRTSSRAETTASIAAFGAMLDEDPSACGAIDLPELTASALDRLGDARSRTMVVDDMAALERYPVALVVNQNAHATRASYPADTSTRLLLGLSFVLLRREFRQRRPSRVVPDIATRILITFGGADPSGMTRRTIEAVAAQRRPVEVLAILGSAYAGSRGFDNIVRPPTMSLNVEESVDDMSARIDWAHLAVTSGGSTVWELARLGCPAVVVETVPAETMLVSGLEDVDLFDRLGPAECLDRDALVSSLEARIVDKSWRETMARRGPVLIDGEGADRVAAALASLVAG